MTPLLALLAAYCVALIALGSWVARRVHKAGDFFVGGRSLGAGAIFATFLAANIGASATIGATGLAYREGLAAWWWSGSAGLGSLVLAFVIGPRIWREASQLKLLTVGDFLEHHYGRVTRGIAAVIIWLSSLWILAGQFIAVAVVLNQSAAGGLAKPFGCLVAAVVMTAYFSGGGLLSTVAVNRVQLVVKLAGFAIAAPLAVIGAHGLQTVLDVNAGHMNFWLGSTYSTGWPLLFLLGPAFIVSPGLLQKAFGARDTRALTTGIAMNGVFLMLFAAAPIALGMTARVLYPHLADAQDALPQVLAGGVSFAVGGLALAAVMSAEMSAADAVLFMLATSVARDCYRGVFRPDATDAQVLRVVRIAAVASGALGFALTFSSTSVLDALKTFYSVLGVTLFAPIVGALYFRSAGAAAALGSMAAGIATLFVATEISPGGQGWAWLSPNLAGLIANAVVFMAVGGVSVLRGRR